MVDTSSKHNEEWKMKIRKREEKTWHGIFKTEDNHVSDHMGEITDACDSGGAALSVEL